MRNLTYLKHFPKMLTILMSVIFLFTSCSKDVMDEFINEDNNTEVTDPSNPEDGGEETDPADPGSGNDFSDLGEINTTPCDYDLSALSTGETLVVDCTIDLNGNTVNLPADVTLDFNGGQIINGSLNFSGGKIAGELLNYQLEITGEASLISSEFNFYPSRWDIVQGKVDDATARTNRDNFESVLQLIKKLGGSTFSINEFDAFFKTDGVFNQTVPQDEAIGIPGDFTLLMTDNTHLRVQPNAYKNTVLMAVSNVQNVVINGGIFHGDRDEHDYSDGGTHEWGHLLLLKACQNVLVKNATFMDAGGDGVDINALGHSFNANYIPAQFVTVSNNVFLRNRRNNLSVTDGRDIVIENNQFLDASIHTDKSNGVAPGFAIDIEAVRRDGKEYEIAKDIVIRNNIEKNSRVGGFTIHTGDYITIEGNQMQSNISYSTTIGTIIRNNHLEAETERQMTSLSGIYAGLAGENYTKNIEISGNVIKNFSTGIKVTNKDLKISDNQILNCRWGLILETARNFDIKGNVIVSDKANADGIVIEKSDYLDNVSFLQNQVNVSRTPLKLVNVNAKTGSENFKVEFLENEFESNSLSAFSSSRGINFNNNFIKQGGLILLNATDIKLEGNQITSTVSHGVYLKEINNNIQISNNQIEVSSSHECISDASQSGSSNIAISSNSCN